MFRKAVNHMDIKIQKELDLIKESVLLFLLN